MREHVESKRKLRSTVSTIIASQRFARTMKEKTPPKETNGASTDSGDDEGFHTSEEGEASPKKRKERPSVTQKMDEMGEKFDKMRASE